MLDTFDGRLHDAGVRLVLHGAPAAALVMHGPSGPPARLEGTSALRWPDDLPAGPLRTRLGAITKERALLPLLAINARCRRAERIDRRGKVVAAVEVLDEVDVESSGLGTVPAWVAETVRIVGHDAEADAADRVLRDLGLERCAGDAADAIAGLVGVSLEGYRSSPTVPLDAGEPAFDGFRRVLANLASTIDANLDGTLAATDPEFLHELRVAVRRTRSVLAQGRKVLPDDVRDRYRDAFGSLGSVTGPPRDLDVYVLGWDAYVAPLAPSDISALGAVRVELDRRRHAAHGVLADELGSESTREVLDGWRRWLSDPAIPAPTQRPLGRHVVQRVAKAQASVLRDGRAITPDTPAERLHDLRKDTKKLRYLLECFGSLFPAKPRKGFVTQLKALQDNLGEHQDAEIHLEQLRSLAHDLHDAGVDADVLLAMGRLGEQLERRRAQERADFGERFSGYDTKDNRRALDDLLESASTS